MFEQFINVNYVLLVNDDNTLKYDMFNTRVFTGVLQIYEIVLSKIYYILN